MPTVAVADAAPAAPLPPLRWGTRPDPKATLAYVADGYCAGMDVDLLPEATLVRSGKALAVTVALAEDKGLSRWDELSKGPSNSYNGRPVQIFGSYPDKLYMQMNNGGRAYDVWQVLAYDKTEWKYVLGTDAQQTKQYLHAFAFGGGVVTQTATMDETSYGALAAIGTTAPPMAGDGFRIGAHQVFASGELYTVGEVCNGGDKCTLQSRRFTPGDKVKLDVLGEGNSATIAGKDPNDVWIGAYDGLAFHFDGTRFTKVPLSFKGPVEVHLAPNDEVWLVGTQKISRRAKDGTMTDASLPRARANGGFEMRTIDGIEIGSPWAALSDGSVVKWDGSAWKPVELPRSPFAWTDSKNSPPRAEGVRVRTAADVWVNVKYVEWPSHYAQQIYEERRALLRTIVPQETFRCKARSTGWMKSKEYSGFESWPPSATPECKTPLVLVSASRKDAAVLKDEHPELVEFTVGSHTIVAAKAKDFEQGKKLLGIVGKGVMYSAPELVCADPENTTPL
jgi:hypothetical protein